MLVSYLYALLSIYFTFQVLMPSIHALLSIGELTMVSKDINGRNQKSLLPERLLESNTKWRSSYSHQRRFAGSCDNGS